jgi:multiple sugar transport system substrate-binding protein
MARINRRRFLKASGAAAVGAKMGIAGILASHQAPVFAQANTVHILRWNDFVPAADKVLREVFAPEVQKALGIKLNVETVNANDIPARATSSIQSGNGPDIIMLLNNYPHLYANAAVDVSAVADGWRCPGRSCRCASRTASRGSRRSAPRASPRPGRSTRRWARS